MAYNCNLILSSDLTENKFFKLINSDGYISFYENGQIEFSGTDDEASDFLFNACFKDNFMNKRLIDENDIINIYNCIEINAYKGTIKYIGSYYSKLPNFLV